jgi:hypothetical protein
MTTQTSTPTVTFVSVALLFSSLSIVMYHHMTYKMVYDGDVTRHSQDLKISLCCALPVIGATGRTNLACTRRNNTCNTLVAMRGLTRRARVLYREPRAAE